VPRPNKQINRQKLAAANAWKKGKRAEAYKLWAEADKASKERQAKKRNKKAAKTDGGQASPGE
jgi:hypothetical protein